MATANSTTHTNDIYSEILKITLDVNRVNDLRVGTDLYRLDTREDRYNKGEFVPVLVSITTGIQYGLSWYALAALRCVTSECKVEWLSDFKGSAGATNLQTLVKEHTGKDLSEIKLKVVHQLKVGNRMITTRQEPVYQDNCYEGVLKYSIEVRKLLAGRTQAAVVDNFGEYGIKKAALRDELHTTAVKAGMATEQNTVYVPVFEFIF
jgi:hypothetical protein